MELNKDIPLPSYYQIANIIRNQILTGELPAGAKLPTEEILANQYSVSRPTIRKAKKALIDDELIYSVQGSGAYANDPSAVASRINYSQSMKEWVTFGKNVTLKIHEYSLARTAEHITRKLMVLDDEFTYRTSGVYFYLDRPMVFIQQYFPRKIGETLPIGTFPYLLGEKLPTDLPGRSTFLEQFEESANIRIKEGVRSLYPGRAEKTEAALLRIEEGDLVLIGETVVVDFDDRPVVFMINKYREDFRLNIRIERAAVAS